MKKAFLYLLIAFAAITICASPTFAGHEEALSMIDKVRGHIVAAKLALLKKEIELKKVQETLIKTQAALKKANDNLKRAKAALKKIGNALKASGNSRKALSSLNAIYKEALNKCENKSSTKEKKLEN